MNFKLKTPTFWENYEYFINEEKKVVVAKEQYLCTDFYRKLDELDINPHIKQFICTEWVKFCNRKNCFSVTAKATCSPEDKFEPMIGTEIARLRLETKIQHLYGVFFSEIEEKLASVSENFAYLTERVLGKEIFLKDKLIELYYEIDESEAYISE
jgi:hypothetical protein